MTTNGVWLAVLAAVLMLAPLAAADDDQGDHPTEERPLDDDGAASEDDPSSAECPPEHFCTTGTNDTGGEDIQSGSEDCLGCKDGDYVEENCIDCLPYSGDDSDLSDEEQAHYSGLAGDPETNAAGDEKAESSGLVPIIAAASGLASLSFMAALRRRG